MQYCSNCGQQVTTQIPPGDNRERSVCLSCDTIHYVNPKLVVGCILTWENKVLLCKRSIEPRLGYWTLPAGFMENGESAAEGAAREANEEANALAESLELFGVYSLPRISQVYMMFLGQLKNGFASAGEESLEVGLFEQQDIPWSELAFPVVTESLERFFSRSQSTSERAYLADVHSRPGQDIKIVRHH
ncbi:MAG: NUDIX hydrolase [Pseudomonadota bacterium]